MLIERIVFIDIETTGLDPVADGIIELGAVRLENGRIVASFGELVNPGRPVPRAIEKLTGIRDADLASARSEREVLEDFLDFLGDDILAAHNASFEASFLGPRTGLGSFEGALDTLLLARVLLPELAGHSLESLARHYGIAARQSHRGAEDAAATAQLWLHLEEALLALPLPILREMHWLMAQERHPMKDLIERAEFAVRRDHPEAEKLRLRDVLREVAPPAAGAREERVPAAAPIDVGAVAGALSAAGVLGRGLDGYEERPEQIRMARAVAEAMNDSVHLLVEAGTGTGKSLAYLVPAIYMASKNGLKVVVSTNTKNLQSQLYHKDLPFLAENLGVEFKAALIKGRGNYLCARKLLYLLEEAAGELDDSERTALLPVLAWLGRTETGDMEENTGLGALDRTGAVRYRLCSGSEDCMGRSCRLRGRCFVAKSRAEALEADVIIANHALFFSELASESRVLPEHEYLVFDEAHNIEDVATEHLACRVGRRRLGLILNRLHRGGLRGGTGLIPVFLKKLTDRGGRETTMVRLRGLAEGISSAVGLARKAAGDFFRDLGAVMGEGGDQRRFSGPTKRPELWGPVEEAKRDLVGRLGALAKAAEELARELADPKRAKLRHRSEFEKELAAQALRLRSFIDDVEFVTAAQEPNFVYWVQPAPGPGKSFEAAAAPIDISRLMVEQLYGRKRSVIHSSATLTVGGGFDFMAGRLGLARLPGERVRTLSAGSSFDFAEQARLLVPSFLPDPGEEAFAPALVGLLEELIRAARGRTLVLFTSYDLLDRVYDALGPRLAGHGISLLAQGRDGSRERLLAVFKEEAACALMATDSFWEGVDVKGQALSCLVVAKLPFRVHTDPIVQARCEAVEAAGAGAFMAYQLPLAVLKLKQGFGRLIRSRTDRGVAVICDKRIVTKRYGARFIRSLPVSHRVVKDVRSLASAAADFLDRPGPEKKRGDGR